MNSSIPSSVRIHLRAFFVLGAATTFLLSLSLAQAATYTWDGGSGVNDDFGQGANWVGDTSPSEFDNLVFTGSTPRQSPWNNNFAFINYTNYTFASGASPFTIVGNSLGIQGVVANNSTSLQTFNVSQNDSGGGVAFRIQSGTNSSINAASGDITFNVPNAYMDQSSLSITTGAGVTVTFNAKLRNGGGQGSAGMVANGSGTVILNQYSQYNGGTTVNGGTVRFVNSKSGNSGSNGVGSNNYAIASGATLEFNVTGNNSVAFDGYAGGTISGTGTFLKTGSGTLLFGGPVGGNTQVALSAGALIDVQGGTLRNDYGRQDWDNNNASMNVASGATVDTWDGINGIRVDALTGSGTVQHTNYNTFGGGDTVNFTVGVANGSGTFAGILRDEDGGGGGGTHLLSLTKNGTGTQTLTGANTYRGITTVNAGTLLVNGNQSTASGAVTVATSGTLGGSGIIGGATTINGTLSPGNSPGLLTFNSNLTLASTANSIFEINGTTEGVTYDSVEIAGSLAYGGTLTIDFGFFPVLNSTYNLFDFAGQSGSFSSLVFLDSGFNGTFDAPSGILTVTAIPEPGAVTLLALGLGVLLWRKRSRQVAA